jgi:hypothetical protein
VTAKCERIRHSIRMPRRNIQCAREHTPGSLCTKRSNNNNGGFSGILKVVGAQTFVSREVVEAAVVAGRYELPRLEGVRYFGFVDPSGGSSGAQEQRGAQRQPSTTERGTTKQGQAGVTGGGRAGSVQLSEQQRSKIKTIVTGEHAPRFSGNVNFDVRVGTKIPRSVHIATLPDDIVQVVPEYRGYDYVLVRDEILIIDPSTLEILAVIPA